MTPFTNCNRKGKKEFGDWTVYSTIAEVAKHLFLTTLAFATSPNVPGTMHAKVAMLMRSMVNLH